MTEKKPVICIIESNEADRELCRHYLLQDVGYTYSFFEEETGEKGLELCRAAQPDCILLAYNLPDIDGLEFLSRLAGKSGSTPYPVIMLTGSGDEAVAISAMKRGAQDYLVKDEMTAGNLFRAVHNAIERVSLRRILEMQSRDLELRNQEMQAFAYALAHDLRAPLRIMDGFARIIARDYGEALDEDGRHYVTNIVQASVQMERLIDELLSYTRIERRAIRVRPVALGYLLRRIVDDCAFRIKEAGVIVMLADDLPMVSGDPILLNQVFANLLDNALTYTRPGVRPEVTINWQADGHYAVIGIKDNGVGIVSSDREKIFQIFQRLHGYEEYPGTGIGLAIVKKAVELVSGQVWVESTPDQGSAFYVKLLICNETDSGAKRVT